VLQAGDDVNNKKPHPEIYNTARARLGLPAERCLVVEDSLVGLRAAVGANMVRNEGPPLSLTGGESHPPPPPLHFSSTAAELPDQ
jgi:FMN phosphatase YigB (HAD superfamily)